MGAILSTRSRLYLARHGETQWNVEKRIQGQLDSSLTDLGIAQATSLAHQAKALNVSLIVSSSLERAKKTAAITAEQLAINTVEVAGLEERDFGNWQGKLLSELKGFQDYQEIFHQVTNHFPPAGESAKQASIRFTQALTSIIKEHPQKNCLVISHGDVLRCFLSMLNMPLIGDAYSEFSNGCLLTIDYHHNEQRFSLV